MSDNFDSYSANLAFAMLVGDTNGTAEICSKAMTAATKALLRLVEQQPKADLPFWLASMRILSTSMPNVLSASGKDLMDKLVNRTTAIVVDKESFLEQLRQEGESE